LENDGLNYSLTVLLINSRSDSPQSGRPCPNKSSFCWDVSHLSSTWHGVQGYLLHNARWHVLRATCYVLHATCYMLHATCYMLHATRYMLHATCYMLRATCYMLHAACYNLTQNTYVYNLLTPALYQISLYTTIASVSREPHATPCNPTRTLYQTHLTGLGFRVLGSGCRV
jgi:hypothetical protein